MKAKRCKKCGSPTKCIMCHGSRIYPYRPFPPDIKWGDCAACYGSGFEHFDIPISGYPGHLARSTA